jgi:serine/threonine protein phosphatase 1
MVRHTPQKPGEILDVSVPKCIDTFYPDGGWLTAPDVYTGQVWQEKTRPGS